MPVVRNIAAFVKLMRAGDERLLMRALSRHDDVQVASVLEILDAPEQDRVLQLLPIERRPEVLGAMRTEFAAGVIGRLAPEEAADLLYHALAALLATGASLEDLLGELERRR